MARALKGTLTLCLALGLTNITWGQGQPSNQQQALGILSNPDVQKELKLSGEQLSKLKDALGNVWDKHKADFARLVRMSVEEREKRMRVFMEDCNKARAGILDDKQMKRLRQIELQITGGHALVHDLDLQKELKLSDEQKKKLDGILNDANKKMEQMAQIGERSQEKYQAVLKDMEEKANGVLTDEQKKNFKELKGQPFQISPPKSKK